MIGVLALVTIANLGLLALNVRERRQVERWARGKRRQLERAVRWPQ